MSAPYQLNAVAKHKAKNQQVLEHLASEGWEIKHGHAYKIGANGRKYKYEFRPLKVKLYVQTVIEPTEYSGKRYLWSRIRTMTYDKIRIKEKRNEK